MTTAHQEEPIITVREGLDVIILIYLIFVAYQMAKGEKL